MPILDDIKRRQEMLTGASYDDSPLLEQEEKQEERGEFVKGILRGKDQADASLFGAAMLLGDAIDNDTIRRWGLEGYQRNMEEAAQNAAAVQRIEDVDGVYTAAQWLSGTLGELAPSAAETIVSAIIGGGVGGVLGKTLIKKAAKEAVEDLVQKKVAREVAEEVVKRQLGKQIGQKAGLAGFSAALESGGMFGEDVEEVGFKEANPISAAMFGTASGMLELFGAESRVVKKIFGKAGEEASKIALREGKRDALKYLGAETLKTALGEGATEAGQEVLGILNRRFNREGLGYEPTAEEWSQVLNATAKGLAGGAGMHAITAPFHRRAEAQDDDNIGADAELKSLEQEEIQLDSDIDAALLGDNPEAANQATERKKDVQRRKTQVKKKQDAERRVVDKLKSDLTKGFDKALEQQPGPAIEPSAPKTKTQVVEELRSKKVELEKEIESNTQQLIFGRPEDVEEQTNIIKRGKALNTQMKEINRILDYNDEFGNNIPEFEGERLFSLSPTTIQKREVQKQRQDREAREKEVEQAVQQEQAALRAQATVAGAPRKTTRPGEAELPPTAVPLPDFPELREGPLPMDERDINYLLSEFRKQKEESTPIITDKRATSADVQAEQDKLNRLQVVLEERIAREQQQLEQARRDERTVEQIEENDRFAEELAIAEEEALKGRELQRRIEQARLDNLPAPIRTREFIPAPELVEQPVPEEVIPITDVRAETREVAPDLPILDVQGRPIARTVPSRQALVKEASKPRKGVIKKPKGKRSEQEQKAATEAKKTTRQPIRSKSGKPFESKAAARGAIAKLGKNAPFEYKVVRDGEGFAIRPKTKFEKSQRIKFRRKAPGKFKLEHTRGKTHFLVDENGNDVARMELDIMADGAVLRDLEAAEIGMGYGRAAIDFLVKEFGAITTGTDGDYMSTDATHMIKSLAQSGKYNILSTPLKAKKGTKGKRTSTFAFEPTNHFLIVEKNPKGKVVKNARTPKNIFSARVKKLVGEISSRFEAVTQGRVNIKSVPTVSWIEDITGESLSKDAMGGYNPETNTIYIVEENVGNNIQELKNTIIHELRHFSIQELFGDQVAPILEDFVNTREQEVLNYLDEFGLENTKDNRLLAAEELIVESYLTDTPTTLVERLISKVKSMLRKMFGSIHLSDNDIKVFLEQLQKNLITRRESIKPTVKKPTKFRHSRSFEAASKLVGQKPTLLDSAKDVWNTVTNKEQRGKAIRQLFDHTLALRGIDDPAAVKLHEKRRLLASADNIANYSLIEGSLTWNPETNWITIDSKDTDGPLTQLRRLGGWADVFMMWMQAQSVKELKESGRVGKNFYGKNVKDEDIIASIEREANAAIADVGKEQWNRTLKAFQDVTKAKLDIAEKSGLVDPDLRADWERMVYVPLYRNLEQELAEDIANLDPAAMNKTINDGIKKLAANGIVGELADPLESFIGNYKFMINESLKNQMWKEGIAVMLRTNSAKAVKSFKKNQQVLGVKVKGEVRYFQIEDAALFEALQELPQPVTGLLGKIFTVPKKVLTKMATFTPAFQVRNFVRDTLHTWILMGDNVGFFEAWKDAVKGFKDVLANDQDFRVLMSQGGAFAEFDAQGKINASSIKSKAKSFLSQSFMWKNWQKIAHAAENANRLAMYRRMKKHGADEISASYGAKDVLDFSATGKSQVLRAAMMAIPFLNARLQGFSKIGREFSNRDKTAMMMRASILSMAAMVLGLSNSDKEEWKELPDYEKFGSMVTWIGDTKIRIPLPFELGVFYTLPMAGMEIMTGNEEGKFVGKLLSNTLTETFEVNPIPQAFKPVLEDWMNEDMFRDRPIVSTWERGIDPKLQFTPWNNHTVRILAQSMPEFAPDWMKSPKRLEHMLTGYFSTASKMAFGFSDMVLNLTGITPRPASSGTLENVLGVTTLDRLVTTEKSKLTRTQQKVYDEMESYLQALSTYQELKSRKQIGQARGYLQANRKEIRMAKYYQGWQHSLKRLNTEARIIERSRMSEEEKWAKQQRLINRKARIFMKIYDRMVKEGVFKPRR